MPNCDKAANPGFIGKPEKYRWYLQIAPRASGAARLPPEQAAKASGLADYFEALADDPSCEVPIER